jgi:hypothetical protein
MVNSFFASGLMIIFIMVALPVKIFAEDVKEYYWWDGSQKRVIKVVEDVLVEIPNSKPVTSGSIAVGKQKITEKLKSLPAAFKIEKIEGEGHFAKIHVRSNNFHEDIKQDLGGQFSPLFQDGATGKALAGGVIITFKSAKTDEEAKAWAESLGIKLKQKMGLLNGKTWLVESIAGLASLDLANQLHDSPDIENSQPNWAHDFSSRNTIPRGLAVPLSKTQPVSSKKEVLKKDMLKPANKK